MKIACIFSGQGAQSAGMGWELYEAFPVCRRVFDAAEAALDFPLKEMCFGAEGGALDLTENAQPAILTLSAACLALLEENGIGFDYAAGLSLGEYSALYAAGVFSLEDAARLTRRRGELMADAMPEGFGAMSAILGLTAEDVERVCGEASENSGRVWAANYNAPGQIVISGERSAVARAERLCLESGAKRAVRLSVSGAFHTPYLDAAADKLDMELGRVGIQEPRLPVLSNLSGDIFPSREEVSPYLRRQMVSPVRWEQTVRRMLELGVDTFVELGPGRTLCGFVKKITKDAAVYNIEDARSCEKTLNALR